MLLRPVSFHVLQIGAHWEVSCTLRDRAVTRHPDRLSALLAAETAAILLWEQQQVTSEVAICEDDGEWHTVARFGGLLDR